MVSIRPLQNALSLVWNSRAQSDVTSQRAHPEAKRPSTRRERAASLACEHCRGCDQPITQRRLRDYPHALLCSTCVEERLDRLAADSL